MLTTLLKRVFSHTGNSNRRRSRRSCGIAEILETRQLMSAANVLVGFDGRLWQGSTGHTGQRQPPQDFNRDAAETLNPSWNTSRRMELVDHESNRGVIEGYVASAIDVTSNEEGTQVRIDSTNSFLYDHQSSYRILRETVSTYIETQFYILGGSGTPYEMTVSANHTSKENVSTSWDVSSGKSLTEGNFRWPKPTIDGHVVSGRSRSATIEHEGLTYSLIGSISSYMSTYAGSASGVGPYKFYGDITGRLDILVRAGKQLQPPKPDFAATDIALNLGYDPEATGNDIVFTINTAKYTSTNISTQIEFYAARGERPKDRFHLSFETFRIDSTVLDQNGVSVLESGFHTLSIKMPWIDPDVFDGKYIHMVIDEAELVTETNELNNEAWVKLLAPEVVNVVTHGWNPTGDDWNSFTTTFRDIGRKLEKLPTEESGLIGRVESYVPTWQSSTGFTKAFALLGVSKIMSATADYVGGFRGYGFRLAAKGFEIAARIEAKTSRKYAFAEATRIVDDLERHFLLKPNKSNAHQKLQLIGHSRGAAVNAEVSRLLKSRGYTNVVYYVSLDGFATDWPDDGGLIGDLDIARVAQADNRLNFRVENTLGDTIIRVAKEYLKEHKASNFSDRDVDRLFGALAKLTVVRDLLALDLRAPKRFGNNVLVKGIGTPSDHANISLQYLNQDRYLSNNYIGDLNRGESQARTVQLHQPTPLAASRLSGRTLEDGSFEEAGTRLRSLQSVAKNFENIPTLHLLFSTLVQHEESLGAAWNTTGKVQLQSFGNQNFARLVQTADTSLGQLVNSDRPIRSIEFDVLAGKLGRGDRLDVSYSGKSIASIDLSDVRRLSRMSIRLGDVGVTGELVFRITGPIETRAVVFLDNISVTTDQPLPRIENVTWNSDESRTEHSRVDENLALGTARVSHQDVSNGVISRNDGSVKEHNSGFKAPESSHGQRDSTDEVFAEFDKIGSAL